MRPAVQSARICLALLLALAANLPGQPASLPAQAAPASGPPVQATANTPNPDSAHAPNTPADSMAKVPKSRSDSVIVVKHHFNHREQIITGSVIMTCLALMMVAMNNYNPR